MKALLIFVIALMTSLVPTYGAVTSLDLDVDADGEVDPLTDGILAIRYSFGFRGATLVNGAVDLVHCARCDAPAIEVHLASLTVDVKMDVDGNREVDALTDGVLALRYLFGFRGATLVGGAVGAGCTRCTGVEIEAHLAGLALFVANDDSYRWFDPITDNALFWRFDATYHPALDPEARRGVLANDSGSGLGVVLVGDPNLATYNPDGSPLGTLSNVLMQFSLSADGSFLLTHDIASLDLGILQFFEGYTKFQYKLTDQEGNDILDENLDPITAWATIHIHPDTSGVATQYEAGMESLLEASTVEDGNLITPAGSIPLLIAMPVLSIAIAPDTVTFTVQPPDPTLALTFTTSLPMVTLDSCPFERTYSEGTSVYCCSVSVVAGACSGIATVLTKTEGLEVTGCAQERCKGSNYEMFRSVFVIPGDWHIGWYRGVQFYGKLFDVHPLPYY